MYSLFATVPIIALGICDRNQISDAEDNSYMHVDDTYYDYNDQYTSAPYRYYVCMPYEYYVAISTLLMICLAGFVFISILILNKIKDHETTVHIAL